MADPTPQPRLWRALAADACVTAANQSRPQPGPSGPAVLATCLRLAWETDAFAAQACARAAARLRSRGLPLLPPLLAALARALAGVSIGPEVRVRPGVYIAHGEVTIRGRAEIGPECVLSPFIEIGPAAGVADGAAPRLGRGVRVGTGARLSGAIEIGDGARIGANASVSTDVPAGATAVGNPARIVPGRGRDAGAATD